MVWVIAHPNGTIGVVRSQHSSQWYYRLMDASSFLLLHIWHREPHQSDVFEYKRMLIPDILSIHFSRYKFERAHMLFLNVTSIIRFPSIKGLWLNYGHWWCVLVHAFMQNSWHIKIPNNFPTHIISSFTHFPRSFHCHKIQLKDMHYISII